MKKEKKQIEDKTRNNNFAAALDYLRRNHESIRNQVTLAKAMKVNKSTITNILRYYTPVTEDAITKLQTAVDGIFNIQFLRGQSGVMLAKDIPDNEPDNSRIDAATLVAELRLRIADRDTIIAGKDALIARNEDIINIMRSQLTEKDDLIEFLRQEINNLRMQVASEKGLHTTGISHSGAVEHPSTSAYDVK